MHSMKNAVELREHAQLSQKQQQDEIRVIGSAAEPAGEEKAGEHEPEREDTTYEGERCHLDSSHCLLDDGGDGSARWKFCGLRVIL